MFFAFITVE